MVCCYVPGSGGANALRIPTGDYHVLITSDFSASNGSMYAELQRP